MFNKKNAQVATAYQGLPSTSPRDTLKDTHCLTQPKTHKTNWQTHQPWRDTPTDTNTLVEISHDSHQFCFHSMISFNIHYTSLPDNTHKHLTEKSVLIVVGGNSGMKLNTLSSTYSSTTNNCTTVPFTVSTIRLQNKYELNIL